MIFIKDPELTNTGLLSRMRLRFVLALFQGIGLDPKLWFRRDQAAMIFPVKIVI